MGIIIKQSIRGSIWSYLGVIIGFVTTSYLYPNYLSTDTVGLFSLLLSWTGLFSVVATLGFPGVTGRLFAYFRDKEKNHNGYLFILMVAFVIGSILFFSVYIIIRPWLIESNLEKSSLFSEYVDLLIPLTVFTLLYIQLDTFIKVLYNAVYGIFVNEFIQRSLLLLSTLLYVINIIDLHQFIISFALIVCLKSVLMVYYLIKRGEFSLRPKFGFITKKLKREMWNVGTYNVLTGMGHSMIYNIDKIIINSIMGLSATGVYSIAFYFGVLVIIPSRPLLSISGTLIADAFRRNDLDYIDDIYHRSSLNQFIIGSFLFGGIAINIDNILTILGPDYASGRWVILLIGLGYLIDMMTGANAYIIAYSRHYRVSLYFTLLLFLLVVVTLFTMVPIWGLTGAALAIALSIMLNNVMRYLFLKYKYDMQPFTLNTVKVAVVFLVSIGISMMVPQLSLVSDLFIRSFLFSLLFVWMIIVFRVSEDIDGMARKLWNRIR